MKYAIHLLYEDGRGSYLEVRGRSTWATKKAAMKHLEQCRVLLAKGRFFAGVVAVDLEHDFFV